MVASTYGRSAYFGVALGVCFSALAHAEPSSQALLTCALGSGELLGTVPRAAAPPPWQELASLETGDGNRVRLVVAREDPGWLPAVRTSAVLRLELAIGAPATSALRDLSSSLGFSWRVGRGTELGLRAFPFDTNYLRLGYLHALDWGGTDRERSESIFLRHAGWVPGLELSLVTARARLFAAAKWASSDDTLTGERRLWGLLSGGRVELLPALSVEAGLGYFQRPALASGADTASFVEGASVRLILHGAAREPELAAEPFRPVGLAQATARFDAEPVPGAALALEAVTLVQRLRRFEEPGRVAWSAAPAAALYGSVRSRSFAAHGVVSWRSLAFVQRNDARVASGETLPPSAAARAELTGWLGASWGLPALGLVPSFELGVRLPSALETPSVLPGFSQTLVVGGPAGLEALPPGAGRLPAVSARLAVRFSASASVGLALVGDYQRDPNRVAFPTSPLGVTRGFAPADSLSGFAAAQARY